MLKNGRKMQISIDEMTSTDECGKPLSQTLQGAKLKHDVCRRRIKKTICRYLHKILLTFCRARHANVQECATKLAHSHPRTANHLLSLTLKSKESKQNGGWKNSQPNFKQRQETVAPPCCTPSD